MRTEPQAAAAIFVDASQTSTSRVTVYWDAYTTNEQKGDSEIISYNLQWDIGTGGVEWTDLIGNPVSSLLTSFSVSSMVAPG